MMGGAAQGPNPAERPFGPMHDPAARPLSHVGELIRVGLREQSGADVLAMAGELDVSNVESVRAITAQISNQASGLIVDLGELEYIDSTGISLIYDLAERLRAHGQPLILVCPADGQPGRVLQLTGLTDQVTVQDDLAAALQQLTR